MDTALKIENKESKFIVKHNQLIEARYNLPINEQRIFLYLLSTVRYEQLMFNRIEISAKEIIKMFDLPNNGNSFHAIEEACHKLLTCNIDIAQEDNKVHLITVFTEIEYVKGSGTVYAEFHKKIEPYVLALKSHFTKYKLECVVNFKSQYSIRIYELLKMEEYHAKNGNFFKQIKIEELRKILGIPVNLYKKFNNLETDVIKRASLEISEKSDLVVEYEKIKTGSKTTSVKFVCQQKKNLKRQVFEAPAIENENEIENQIDLRQKLIKEFSILDIKPRVYEVWFKNYNIKLIKNNFEYTMQQYVAKKVKNIVGYMNKALEYNYWNSTQLAKIAHQNMIEQKYKEEQRIQQEKIDKENFEKKQKNKTWDIFQNLEANKQQEIIQTVYKEYPKLTDYFEKKSNSGFIQEFIYIVMNKFYKNLLENA
jgi:plasmid replication initiation protein